MLIECTAIFLLIVTVAFMSVRAKKKDHALAMIPLLLLPFMDIVAYAASGKLSEIFQTDKFTVYSVLLIFASVVSSCFVGIMSVKFPKKSIKTAYIIMSLIFNIALAAILIYNMFEALYR